MSTVTLTAKNKGPSDGFIAAKISNDQSYFSITGDITSSRRAYELGVDPYACGQVTDDIKATWPADEFPMVALALAMHLRSKTEGEPMHCAANAAFFYQESRFEMLASHLGCDVSEVGLPNVEALLNFIDSLRPKWRQQAAELNAWIEDNANEGGEDGPPEPSEEFEVTLEGDLKVHAIVEPNAVQATHVSYLAWVNEYVVTVSTPNHTYTTSYRGSIAEHQDNEVAAAQAAMATLKDLTAFLYQSADELAEDWGVDPEAEDYETTMASMRKAEAAADAMSDELNLNLSSIT